MAQNTFIFLKILQKSLHVIALSCHVDQDVILFPLTLLLVGIHELGGALAVEPLSLLNIAFLVQVFLFGRCESSP